MNVSTKESSSAYELTWSLTAAGPEKPLLLSYSVHAHEELYLGDRLWDYAKGGARIPDPFGVYRFVRDGSLRLVFAQAPWPANVSPRVVYQPLYSRLKAGETRRREIPIDQPVDEYSALSRDISAPTVVEEVSRVLLVLSYRLRSSMPEDPQPPPNESAEEAGYIVADPKLLTSTVEVERLKVKRRTGYMARFALPGEPGPGPVEPPKPPAK